MEAEARTNSTRRAAAIGVILLGGVALWWLGGSGADITSAKNTMARSIAAGQKRTGASDPRLAGAHRFEEGGWIYVHLEGDGAAGGWGGRAATQPTGSQGQGGDGYRVRETA